MTIWIAGVGLMSDNVVMIVASMLVSALMGPILGFTFGCVIRDWDMVARGAINELIGEHSFVTQTYICTHKYINKYIYVHIQIYTC
jgi:uncharacterized membrane protein